MVISSRRLQLQSTCEASKRFWVWSTHSRTIYQSKRLDETYTPVLTASGSAEIQKIDLKCGLHTGHISWRHSFTAERSAVLRWMC